MSLLSPDRPQLAEHMTAALEGAVDRHFAVAREWFPHEHVPWSEGKDFAELPWEETQSRLDPAVRTAVILNLLTEDNLPGYATELDRLLGTHGEAWRTWLHRWTAEEGRHAIALRDYLTVTRAVDPVQLERDRMATVQAGFAAPDKDALRTIAYVSMQELATRVAHRGTGRLSNDPGLDKLLARISADENLHMLMYRDLFTAALEVEPEAAIEALIAEIVGFAMPGTGIPGFVRKAAVVARAGIYDLQIHRDEVVKPLLRAWRVFDLELDGAAEKQRETLVAVMDELDRRVERAAQRRPARAGA